MSIGGTSRLARGKDVMAAVLDDTVMLMSAESDGYYGLDGVARAVWDRLETPATFDEVHAHLVAMFEHDPGAIRADLIAFVEDASAEGVLDVA